MFFSTPAAPSADQILKKVRHAYDSVSTLTESVHATTNAFPTDAQITFKRPGHLRVTGTSMFKAPYELVCDGTKAWTKMNGQWSRMENPETGIATITGVSGMAGSTIPALLFHTQWASLNQFEGKKTKVSTVLVSGHKTYKLDIKVPFPSSVWVDSRTYMLVGLQSVVMKSKIVVNFGPPKLNGPVPASAFSRG